MSIHHLQIPPMRVCQLRRAFHERSDRHLGDIREKALGEDLIVSREAERIGHQVRPEAMRQEAHEPPGGCSPATRPADGPPAVPTIAARTVTPRSDAKRMAAGCTTPARCCPHKSATERAQTSRPIIAHHRAIRNVGRGQSAPGRTGARSRGGVRASTPSRALPPADQHQDQRPARGVRAGSLC
jgi:hypothetical protein